MTEEPLVILNCDECWPQTTDGKAPSGETETNWTSRTYFICTDPENTPEDWISSDSYKNVFSGPFITSIRGADVIGDLSRCAGPYECVRSYKHKEEVKVKITNAPKGTIFKARLEIDWYNTEIRLEPPGGEGGACLENEIQEYRNTEVRILEIEADIWTSITVIYNTGITFTAWLTACQCDCYENEK